MLFVYRVHTVGVCYFLDPVPVDGAMMLNDSSDDGCGGDRDVMRWPDVECETMQYERGVRPAIGRKPPGKTRFPGMLYIKTETYQMNNPAIHSRTNHLVQR